MFDFVSFWFPIFYATPVIILLVLHLHFVRKRKREHEAIELFSHRTRIPYLLGKNAEPARCLNSTETRRQQRKAYLTSGLFLFAPLVSPTDFPVNFSMRFQRGRWSVRYAQSQWNKLKFKNYGGAGTVVRTVTGHSSLEISTPNSPYLALHLNSPDSVTPNVLASSSEDPPAALDQWPHLWQTVRVPAGYETTLVARSSDPEFARLVLTSPAIEWLRHNSELWWETSVNIRFAPGVLYIDGPAPIPVDNLVPTTDLLVGFLERIPSHAWARTQQGPHEPRKAHQHT